MSCREHFAGLWIGSIKVKNKKIQPPVALNQPTNLDLHNVSSHYFPTPYQILPNLLFIYIYLNILEYQPFEWLLQFCPSIVWVIYKSFYPSLLKVKGIGFVNFFLEISGIWRYYTNVISLLSGSITQFIYLLKHLNYNL